jgi:glycosyltransferase involved in cell wall biosynthesis
MLPADITLILPTRDEARNIRQFLASVPAQIRLIVVDASRTRRRT